MNINQACQREKCLFSPYIYFQVPQFELLPAEYFSECHELKLNFAKGIQTSAVNGLAFTMELILLRTFKLIKDQVETLGQESAALTQLIMYFFLKFFVAAEGNFQKTFKSKDIDWDKKECRVKSILPKWRRQETPTPPLVRPNRYVRVLSEKLSKGSAKISSLGIIQHCKSDKSANSTEPKERGNAVQGTSSKSKVSSNTYTEKTTVYRNVKEITKDKDKPVNQAIPDRKDARNSAFNKNRNIDREEANLGPNSNGSNSQPNSNIPPQVLQN